MDQHQPKVEQLVAQFKAGAIERRVALKQLLGLGISAPAAYVLIGELKESDIARAQPLSDELQKRLAITTQNLVKISSSPQAVEVLKKLRDAGSEYNKLRLAEEWAKLSTSNEYLSKIGYVLTEGSPDKIRITTRVFENREPYTDDPAKQRTLARFRRDPGGPRPDQITICASSGPGGIICLSVGKDF